MTTNVRWSGLALLLAVPSAWASPINFTEFRFDYDLVSQDTGGSVGADNSGSSPFVGNGSDGINYNADNGEGSASMEYTSLQTLITLEGTAETRAQSISYGAVGSNSSNAYVNTTYDFSLDIESNVSYTFQIDVNQGANQFPSSFVGYGLIQLLGYDIFLGTFIELDVLEYESFITGSDVKNVFTTLPQGDYRIEVYSSTGTYADFGGGFVSGDATSSFGLQAQAVPEPATLAVLGLGALLLRRRRR
jgi:hypothetical protein